MDRWIPCWEKDAPEGERVAVKVALKGGDFGDDIAVRNFASGWQVQCFEGATVVAWAALPKT